MSQCVRTARDLFVFVGFLNREGMGRIMLETIAAVNQAVNNFVWGVPAMVCIIGVGLLLSVRTGFLQIRKFPYVIKTTIGRMFRKKDASDGAMTPFQAVCTALAGTVGTGNIAGVAGAIAIGGPGAVFWMWCSALLGMCTKFAEVTLAVHFRERNAAGEWVGGPMYYIKNGMGEKWKWLAGAFSVLAALAAFGIGNMSQANSIVGSVTDAVCAVNPDFSGQAALRWGLGIGLALLTALVLFGGIKRIGAVTEKLIPFMSVAYILMTLIVIFGNLGGVGRAFKAIFSAAFAPRAILGGAAGITIRQAVIWGLRRSAFSNEAGLGSAPIAHAAAHCDGPVEQGIYGIFEVFMDTIVICTLTALTIIISGVDVTFGVKPGSALITAAFGTVFNGTFSSVFIAVALTLFAYSTILGWSLYGSRCVQYLLGLRAAKVYQFIFIIMIVVGSVSSLDFVWNIADTLNGLMAIPNFIALFALSPVIFKITREYFRGVDLASAKHE